MQQTLFESTAVENPGGQAVRVQPLVVPCLDSILCGDALAEMRALPPGCVDAIVSDPPYCSGGFTETQKKQATGQGLRSETLRDVGWFEGDQMTSAGLAFLLRSIAFEGIRLLRGGGSMLFFTDWRMLSILVPAIESAGLRYQNLVVWAKPSAGLGNGFRAQHECVMHFTAGKAEFFDKGTGNVLTCKRTTAQDREHQTQKPVDLMARLIKVVSPPGGVVLDPFAGSGSTLVAAKITGRHWIGIERDPGNCDVANRRIEHMLL